MHRTAPIKFGDTYGPPTCPLSSSSPNGSLSSSLSSAFCWQQERPAPLAGAALAFRAPTTALVPEQREQDGGGGELNHIPPRLCDGEGGWRGGGIPSHLIASSVAVIPLARCFLIAAAVVEVSHTQKAAGEGKGGADPSQIGRQAKENQRRHLLWLAS